METMTTQATDKARTVTAAIQFTNRQHATPITNIRAALDYGRRRFDERYDTARMQPETMRLIVRTKEFRQAAETLYGVSPDMNDADFERESMESFDEAFYAFTGVRVERELINMLIPVGTVLLFTAGDAEHVMIVRGA